MKLPLLRAAVVGIVIALPLAGAAQGGPPTGGGKPPFAGASMTCDAALKMAPKQDPNLATMDKTFAAAQVKLKKTPKDAKVKAAYVEAAYSYGHACMMDRGKLPPAIQYRAALALYRKALAVDPKHKPSLQDKSEIEEVYKSMGRPISQ